MIRVFIAGCVVAWAASARAEAMLEESFPGGARRTAALVYEASCDLDVTLRGAIAEIELRQRFVHPGTAGVGADGVPDDERTTPLGVMYRFDAPRDAVITGFSIRAGGTTETALALPADAPASIAVPGSAIPADPGRLVWVGPDTYEVRLQPILPEREVITTTRMTAVASIEGGAIRLRIPSRASTRRLASCRGSVAALGGSGVSVGAVRVDGVPAPGRTRGAFTIEDKPVVIEAGVTVAGNDPVAWLQTEKLADGWFASALTVIAPIRRVAPTLPRRAVFVIDGSRSMELVGRHHTAHVVSSVASALPAGSRIEAVFYDHAARRLFGELRLVSPDSIAAITREVMSRPSTNGSNLRAALAETRSIASDATRELTQVIVLSDGLLGDVLGSDLVAALDGTPSAVDVLSVQLVPPNADRVSTAAMRAPVTAAGGNFVEIRIGIDDEAFASLAEWLRPGWTSIHAGDEVETPWSLRAGSGFVRTWIHRGTAAKRTVSGEGASSFAIRPRPAPRASVASLALAREPGHPLADSSTGSGRPDGARSRSEAVHPYASPKRALAVLATTGRAAKHRARMIKAGGPYEPIVEIREPDPQPPDAVATPAAQRPSAIDGQALRLLLRQQVQPKAYACYQRALGKTPTLTGTVRYSMHVARGEVTHVAIAGLGHAELDACLLEAGHALTLALPDLARNADDQAIVHYPIELVVADKKPIVILGDADSIAPLDIDGIEGGVPGRAPGGFHPDTKTPLGDLRPSK